MKDTYLTPHGSTTWSTIPAWGVVADDMYYYSQPIHYPRGHCQTGYYHQFFNTEEELNTFISTRLFNEHVPPYREDDGQLPWINNERVEIGYLRVYNEIRYKVVQPHRCEFTPDITPALWEVVPNSDEWIGGAWYIKGKRLLRNEIWYEVLQAHLSQSHFPPEIVPALYEVVPEPVIPIDTPVFSEENKPYAKNDIIHIDNEAYESFVDDNYWHPSIYGWRHIGQVPTDECESARVWDAFINNWNPPVTLNEKVKHNNALYKCLNTTFAWMEPGTTDSEPYWEYIKICN